MIIKTLLFSLQFSLIACNGNGTYGNATYEIQTNNSTSNNCTAAQSELMQERWEIFAENLESLTTLDSRVTELMNQTASLRMASPLLIELNNNYLSRSNVLAEAVRMAIEGLFNWLVDEDIENTKKKNELGKNVAKLKHF